MTVPSDVVPPPAAEILVVDDDRDIRESLQDVLELEGYAVSTARNGQEALAVARASRPALILLDLFMPVMDGVEFRRRQLQDPDLAQVPVVVVSAAPGVEQRVSELGVAGHLEKPLELDQLFDLISLHVQ
jgi:CheY-like chemotaxis protein